MKRMVAAGLLMLPLMACGNREADSDGKIVGGKAVKASDEIAKYTVALVDPDDSSSFCTGTLIGKRHVVTAAHCLVDLPFKPAVGFGVSAAKSKVVAVRGVLANKDYKSDWGANEDDLTTPVNDIGIVELSEDAPASAQIATVLNDSHELKEGEDFILAGYGITSAISQSGSGTLRVVTTKIKAASKARKEIDFGGLKGKSACNGDSGGPAFVQREGKLALTGVTSRGSRRCDEEGTYTDIRYFHDWIKVAELEITTNEK